MQQGVGRYLVLSHSPIDVAINHVVIFTFWALSHQVAWAGVGWCGLWEVGWVGVGWSMGVGRVNQMSCDI